MNLISTPFDDIAASEFALYALQIAVGAIFVASVVPKLRDRRAFARTVVNYEVVDARLAEALAPAVILVECFLAVSLLASVALTAGLIVGAVAVLVFLAATSINLHRGRRVECGCFGDPAELISGRTAARLTLLLVSIGVLLVAHAAGWTSAITPGELAAEGIASLQFLVNAAGLAAAICIAGLWITHIPDLADVIRRSASTPRQGPSPGALPGP